ncbi:MAG: MGMT family protein, partial [Candidatus Omnitrophica bacterium]|nr:MGMT family protein [Candidatus Omnitrophota bacterium]
KRIGRPKAYRAVGNALNKNPFAPIVPCHRVVKSDGSLGGFAKGKRQKLRLLKREGLTLGKISDIIRRQNKR